MHNTNLLHEILRSQWAIEPQTALASGHLIAGLINGDPSDFTPRGKWIFEFASGKDRGSSNSFDQAPAGTVAIIPLKGSMLKYGTLCSYGTQEIASVMQQAFASKKIAAIVMDIDSGGGSVNSIPPLNNLLASKNKPVVALADIAASAAYFVAANCDHIIADNSLSAGFGSIGVVTSFADMQPYWELKGIKFHTIYAPESKDKNLAFEKALKGDYELLQNEILSPLAKQFQNHVKTSRGAKLKADTPGALTGKMFFAEDALKTGLIDSIGNMQKAVEKAMELAEIRKFMQTK
jgi:protease IV